MRRWSETRSRSQGGGGQSQVTAVRTVFAAAVQQMQSTLQEELQEEEIEVYSKLGRGGFGTVYHGARPLRPSALVSHVIPDSAQVSLASFVHEYDQF
jgi:hypothetical protein